MHGDPRVESSDGPAGRTSTFLAANANWGGEVRLVRIRNISHFGALVQSDILPEPGEGVTIEREGILAAGEVMWVRDYTFGVKFSTPTEPAAWFGENPQDIPELSLSGNQEQCDETAQIIFCRLSEEIEFVSRAIDNISEVLVKDVVMRQRHGLTLQELAIGKQMLCEIASILRSNSTISAIKKHASGSMKNRILR